MKEQGITLVALIITITVLIILAGITIFALTDSRLLQTASKGTENYANAQEYEKQIMNDIDEKANEVVKKITDIQEGMSGEDPVTPPAPEEIQLPEGWDKNNVYAYESDDKVIVPVPIGFTPSDVTGEKNVKDGFVIKQDGTANEFVWVPVSDPSEMFGIDKDGNGVGKLYTFNSGVYPLNWKELNGVISWINSDYHEPDVILSFDNTRSNYANAGIVGIENAEQFKKQLQEEFNETKESVERYYGFYIGRYETGDLSKDNAVVAKNNNDIGNQNWYVQYQKNKTIVDIAETKSSMIWGCQWDATLKWFLSSDNIEDIGYVTNSNKKGHYGASKRIPTGSNEDYAVKNIYDMAGNVYDLVLEAYGNNGRSVRRKLLCL